MSKTLDFTSAKKRYLTVKLPDENNTVLMIGTPTKAVMNDLVLLQSGLETLADGANDEALDDLYAVCARVMSRNKTGKKVTKEYLEEIFDFEDIVIFFNAYIDFVSELSNAKN